MPNQPDAGDEEFATLVEGCRSIEELKLGTYTDLRGTVYRGSDAMFALVTADGSMIELETSAVDRFKVVGTGLHPEVEISVSSEALRTARVTTLNSLLAYRKAPIKDIHTDPLYDKVRKDPIFEPAKNVAFDPTATFAEQGVNPGQVVDPALAGGMMPFIMATPHQAPAAAVNMQMGAAALTIKEPISDGTIKELITDHTIKELIYDTIKEVIGDTRKELIYDTTKEIFETSVEGGGTLQEGGGLPGPGGFPGMPGF